ncbi:MAG: hypothetical protein NDI63_04930 [Pseudobdellovibrio sp.]|nr:hypothetical protein [Pseudobdellovibrio sp.]
MDLIQLLDILMLVSIAVGPFALVGTLLRIKLKKGTPASNKVMLTASIIICIVGIIRVVMLRNLMNEGARKQLEMDQRK